MTIRFVIIALAWSVMFLVTFLNVAGPVKLGLNPAIWLGYLIVLTAVILWPSANRGDRAEAGKSWVRPTDLG